MRRRWWSAPPAPTGTALLSARRAYTEVLGVFVVFFAAGIAAAAFSVAGHDPPNTVHGWTQAVPASISQVATTVLCIVVPVLLVSRRGSGPADLGLTRSTKVPLSAAIRMAAWAFLALSVAGLVTGLLATGSYPEGPLTYPNLTVNVLHAAQAGFLEEIIVLAFVVTTLEQARRPRTEIVVVALVLRASYHIYYGPGVVGIFVWASVFLWLFLRFRTIVPLIIVHSSWDVLAILGYRWHLVTGIEAVGGLGLFVVALILWLVYRQARLGPGPILAAPGWYPDPSGGAGLRWFDSRNWGPVAYPPPPSHPD